MEGKRNKAAERNSYILALTSCTVASVMGLSVNCSDRMGRGDWEVGKKGVWSEVEPVSGREKVSSLSV